MHGQAAMLRALQFDFGQGSYFAPLLPGATIAGLLAQQTRLPTEHGTETVAAEVAG